MEEVKTFVKWCSLFCTGHQAIGELNVPIGDTDVAIPVCLECMEYVTGFPKEVYEKITGIKPGA